MWTDLKLASKKKLFFIFKILLGKKNANFPFLTDNSKFPNDSCDGETESKRTDSLVDVKKKYENKNCLRSIKSDP